ncbi:hypothetical protein ACSSV1_005724 [Labrenzia sp. MBR-25]
MPSSLPLLLPAGILARKTPVKNDPVLGDQSSVTKSSALRVRIRWRRRCLYNILSPVPTKTPNCGNVNTHGSSRSVEKISRSFPPSNRKTKSIGLSGDWKSTPTTVLPFRIEETPRDWSSKHPRKMPLPSNIRQTDCVLKLQLSPEITKVVSSQDENEIRSGSSIFTADKKDRISIILHNMSSFANIFLSLSASHT